MTRKSSLQLTIEALTPADIPAAMELKDALGWNQTEGDWERFLRLAPDGAFKLVSGDELCGTAMAFVFDEVCWIGMVIVKEAYRGQGHGNLLMQRCLEHASARRCTLVQLDATKDGVSLYARLGFKPAHLVGTCRGRIVVPPDAPGAGRTGADGPLSVAPVRPNDLAELAALEAEALGASREPLLRELVADPGGRGCGGTVCRRASGELAGFLLHRPGHHSIQIGPLIARDGEAAAALLETTLHGLCARSPACDVSLTVPLYSRIMPGELRRWGLPVTPRLTRMFRGWRRLQAREDMVYALSGPEKG